MRSFEELTKAARAAVRTQDKPQLRACAEEFSAMGTPEGEAYAASVYGLVSRLEGQLDDALSWYDRAMQKYQELGDVDRIASTYRSIGDAYLHSGMHVDAMEMYHKALQYYEEVNNTAELAYLSNHIGVAYQRAGALPEALEWLERARALCEQSGPEERSGSILINLSSVLNELSHYEQALQNLVEAAEINRTLGLRHGEATAHQGMGTVLFGQMKYEESLAQLDAAIAIYREVGDDQGLGASLVNKCAVFIEMGDFDALEEHLRLLDTDEQSTPEHRINVFARHGVLNQERKNFEAAHEAFSRALEIAQAASLPKQELGMHANLRDLCRKRNDLEGYILHNDEFQRITEELYGKEATQKLAMLEAEKKIAAERQEREKERALLYGALPEHIATRMLRGETVEDHFENAAVLFADIAGFTTHSSSMHPSETIKLLEDLYKTFDVICAEHGVTKVKTIGDSYLCFGESSEQIAAVALQMMSTDHTWPDGSPLQLRIGIHSGSVSAGVIGTQRLQYDIWGDTVNTASRMESTGKRGKCRCRKRLWGPAPFGRRMT